MGIVFHNIYVSDEFVIICDTPQEEMHRLGEELAKELPSGKNAAAQWWSADIRIHGERFKEVYLSTKVALLSKEYRNYNYVGIADEDGKNEGKKRISSEQERNLTQSVRMKNKKRLCPF